MVVDIHFLKTQHCPPDNSLSLTESIKQNDFRLWGSNRFSLTVFSVWPICSQSFCRKWCSNDSKCCCFKFLRAALGIFLTHAGAAHLGPASDVSRWFQFRQDHRQWVSRLPMHPLQISSNRTWQCWEDWGSLWQRITYPDCYTYLYYPLATNAVPIPILIWKGLKHEVSSHRSITCF